MKSQELTNIHYVYFALNGFTYVIPNLPLAIIVQYHV